MGNKDAERLNELEIALMHQERALGEMSDVVRQQWDAIEKLKREIARLEAIKADIDPKDEADRPPPHY